MSDAVEVRSHLFVVTFGRTGSTLLQGILNSLPSCVVFGENEGFLMHLFEAYEALQAAHGKLKNPKADQPKNPWFGSSRYTEEHLLPAFRNLVQEVLFSARPNAEPVNCVTVGFKEIRHIFIGNKDLEKYLHFVLKLYPDAKFLFHTRDVESVLASGWWKRNDPSHTRKQIEQFEIAIAKFAQVHPSISMRTSYDQLLGDTETWIDLCKFLDVGYNEAVMRATIAKNHSYENRALTGLLTGQVADVELLNKSWWQSRIDECRLAIVVEENMKFLRGVILPRPGVALEPVELTCDGVVVAVDTTLPSPEIAEDFPYNPMSGTCAFNTEVPATGAGHLVLRSGKTDIAQMRGSI